MLSLLRTLALNALNLPFYLLHHRHLRGFRETVGYWPNITLPRRYHDFILWRKLFDANPLFEVFCDKLATKDFVASRDATIPVPRTLWSTPAFSAAQGLPIGSDRVIKANHGCDFNDMPSDAPDEPARIEALARQWLAIDWSVFAMEAAYAKVPRRLFAEEKLPVEHPLGLIDINVRCCDGRAVLLSVILNNKTPNAQVAYFDTEGRQLDLGLKAAPHFGQMQAGFTLPNCWRDAVRHAEVLSRGIDYARFDFMSDWKQVWAGEITVYPSAGLSKASPANEIGYDTVVADAWDLRKSWFLSQPQRGWKRAYAALLNRALDARAARARRLARVAPRARRGLFAGLPARRTDRVSSPSRRTP